MKDAESCSDLVAYALCDSYEKHCRCPVGMIQYAGAVCQVRLTGRWINWLQLCLILFEFSLTDNSACRVSN